MIEKEKTTTINFIDVNNGRKAEIEKYFENVDVSKTANHYCMFCDGLADFIITNNNSIPKMELTMCNECAKLLNKKIFKVFSL